MSHIFDPKKFKKLESPERKKMLPVEEVLSFLTLSSSSIIADVGCGIGYFSIPFAETAQEVIAVDINDIMIEELKNRVSSKNIRMLLGDFSELLGKESIDIFFTATVIHEVDNLESFTKKAYEVVKPDGYIIYLDFIKKEMPMGPSYDKRVAHESVISLFNSLEMSEIEVTTISDTFYIVKGKK